MRAPWRRHLRLLLGAPENSFMRTTPSRNRSRRGCVRVRGRGESAGAATKGRRSQVCGPTARRRYATRCCHCRRGDGHHDLGAGEARRHAATRLRPCRAARHRALHGSWAALPAAPRPPADPPRPGRVERVRTTSQPRGRLPSGLLSSGGRIGRRRRDDRGDRRGVRSRPQSRRSPDRAPRGGLQCLSAYPVRHIGGPNPPARPSLGVA
jgi:hypothetical protein